MIRMKAKGTNGGYLSVYKHKHILTLYLSPMTSDLYFLTIEKANLKKG